MAAGDAGTTILGLYATHGEAERAVNMLVQAGFSAEEIGFLGPGDAKEPDYFKSSVAGAGGGTVLGAVAGGLLGVASMAVAPGVGPILTAGAWLPPLVGLATGGAAGGTAGTLFATAVTGDQALHYRQEVQAGRSLVNVTTTKSGEAMAVLEQAGALEVADVGRSESAEKLAEEEPKGQEPKIE